MEGGELVLGSVFGLIDDPTCQVDQTAALREFWAAAAGRHGLLGRGTFCLRSSASTIAWTAPFTRIEGQGAGTILKWAAPAGSPIAPILDVQPSAHHGTLDNIAFDHGADAGGYVDGRYFGTDPRVVPLSGVAVALQADDFSGSNLWGRAGHDNCFMVIRVASGAIVRGSPQRGSLRGVHTSSCGSGDHTAGGPGRIGAGVDNGSGGAWTFSDLIDDHSYGSFISDIGAGAYGTWSNVISLFSQVDRNPNIPAFYVGDANTSLGNVTLIQPAGRGLWIDKAALGTAVSNLNVKAPGDACALIKGPATIATFTCSDPSFGHTGKAPAINLDASAGDIDGLSITGLDITTALSRPSAAIVTADAAGGTHTITGRIDALHLPGAAGAMALGRSAKGLLVTTAGPGGPGSGTTRGDGPATPAP